MARPPLPILQHPSSPRPLSYPPSTSQHYSPFRTTRSFRTRSTTRCALGALTIVCLIFILNELRCAKYGCVTRAGWYVGPPSGAAAGSSSKGNAYPNNVSPAGNLNSGGAAGGPKEGEKADWWMNRVWQTYNKDAKPKDESKGKGKEDGGWIGVDQGTFVTSGTSGQLDEGPDSWNSDATYPGYSAVEEHMKWETTSGSTARPASAKYPSTMRMPLVPSAAFRPGKPSPVLYEELVETSKDGLQAAYHKPDPKNSPAPAVQTMQKPSVAPVTERPSSAPAMEKPSQVPVVERPKSQAVDHAQPATNAEKPYGKEETFASSTDVKFPAVANEAVRAGEAVVKPSATMQQSSNGAGSKGGESVVKPSTAPAAAIPAAAEHPHAVMGDGAGMGVTGGIGMTGGAVGSSGSGV